MLITLFVYMENSLKDGGNVYLKFMCRNNAHPPSYLCAIHLN